MSQNRNNRNNQNNRNNNNRGNNRNAPRGNQRARAARVRKPFNGRIFAIKIFIMILLIAAVVATWFFAGVYVERFINHNIYGYESGALTGVADDGLLIHMIDVGQGDAIFIEFPNGQTMLIDAGRRPAPVMDYLNNRIFYNPARPRRIDYFVLTHSDADHVGGAEEVMAAFCIYTIFRPMTFTTDEIAAGYPMSRYSQYIVTTANPTGQVVEHNTIVFRNFVRDFYAATTLSGTPVNRRVNTYGISLPIGGALVEWLAPVVKFNPQYGATTAAARNGISTMIMVTYNNRRTLLTGDARASTEAGAISLFSPVLAGGVDIFQMPHHGSNNGSSRELLELITPTYVLVSVGQNTYGHPNSNALRRVQDYGRVREENIFTTVRNGNIVASVCSNTGNIAFAMGIENEAITYWVPFWLIFGPILGMIFMGMFVPNMVNQSRPKQGGGNSSRSSSGNRRR